MGGVKKIPARQCCGCREMKNKKEMFRVIRTPEGEIVLDATGRRMDGAHIYARHQSALKRQKSQKALNVH